METVKEISLSERDGRHIWHPLTQHKTHGSALGITKAQGVYLTDENGKSYIDGISSWYTAMYGHCNPQVTDAVTRQMTRLDHVVFSGFTHEPAVNLSEELISVLPDNQDKLFFSDNGSTAVEVGVKIALQYHHNQGQKRRVLLAFEEGFHGDTFGAMSVSGLDVYNGPFSGMGLEVLRLPVPVGDNNEKVLERLRELAGSYDIAAFIFEPLVQGAAAMKMHDARGLDALIAFCRAHGIITIADEVMTGFGKTGTFFASDHLENKPDIICMSKALTAGLMPMAVTSTTKEIFDGFYSDELSKGFFHGHTYTANPLACTAALEGVRLLKSDEIQRRISEISGWHEEFAREIGEHPRVASVRNKGVIFALDIDIKIERYGSFRDRLFHFFMNRGVFLRPLGKTIYILAPYIIEKEEMDKIYAVIKDCLDHLDEFTANTSRE
ncbi:adenosylmethionine--8-amino-7-oxononanoate transaminase [Robertkochia aurantiaca]|uniref:adenosylmethionine--8-amino-7-oxononanoate transaminase n=1 Tax=Robertkochia aurantiaca TaxID=2873700 RepID=UPI001CCCCB8B|nr:adenosylmethionine--8-amino-7-oxononanoate transaminase [Robertkochia sp. 3YJGBD-33]